MNDGDTTEAGAFVRARALFAAHETSAEVVAAFGANKLSTAHLVLSELAEGKSADQELQGLARGALADVESLLRVLIALSGKKVGR